MYTYAFLASSVRLDLPLGIVGSLELVDAGGIAALVEPDLTLETLQETEERLMQGVLCHDRVIRQVFEQTPLLPLQFGTYFVSREGVLEHLHTRSAEYLQTLDRLQGKAEYALKLTPLALTEPAISADTKGKAYFLAKKQRYQTLVEQQQQQQAEFDRVIESIAQSYPDRALSEAKEGKRLYLLSDREAESTLRRSLPIWQTQCRYWQIDLGEALPPYHFV